jgi:hypothetical protein
VSPDAVFEAGEFAQALGGVLAYGLVRVLYPEAASVAAEMTAPSPAPATVEEPS